MWHRLTLFGVLITQVFIVGCSDEADSCDAAVLRDALEAASEGQTVTVGSCTISGTFVIPEGVTLSGAGQGVSTIVAEGEEPALRLLPGDVSTQVQNLTIVSDERVAVLAMGSGRAALTRVDVQATRGIALGAEDLSELTLESVDLSGPITSANAESVSLETTYEETATIGAILAAVDAATLTEVTVTGFADHGLVAVETDLRWDGGGAPRNRGSGLLVFSGRAELNGLDLGETLAGRPLQTYAAFFAHGAAVESTELAVNRSQGYGLVHDDATVSHTDIVANDNADAAIWVQRCPSFELSGSMSELDANRFAGIALIETGETMISGASISNTIAVTELIDELYRAEIGDGISAVDPGSVLTIRDVNLTENARVGALLDLNESEATITLENVVVDGTGEQYGVIAQGRDPGAGWDDGVVRSGATAINDEALATPLPLSNRRVSEDFPIALNVADQGVAGIIGDCGLPEPDR